MKTHLFKTGGLHCEGCVNSVRSILQQQDGVSAAKVDLATGDTSVEARDSFDPAAAIKAVAKAGFTLQPV
jgi:copper chaperone CopZ